MAHTLVLNATYEPLGVVVDRRALLLVLASKAISIEESGREVRSPSGSLVLPSVIRLNRFVRVPHRAGVPLTRRAVENHRQFHTVHRVAVPVPGSGAFLWAFGIARRYAI